MGARVFILDDGTQATVPDESIDKWMQRMDQRGVKFRDANMTGEMQVGEPEAIKRNPVELPEVTITAEKKPWYQALADSVFPTRSDEEARANPLGIGDDSRAAAAAWQSAADHPMRALGGQLASHAAAALAPEGVAGSALGGELAGAAEHYSRSDSGDLGEALRAGIPAALVGGGIAAGGKALGWLGGLTQAGADRARMGTLNATSDDLAELGMTPREFSQRSDELGLNNAVMPMGREAKLARARAALGDAGSRQGAAVAEADAAGVAAGRDFPGEIARDIDVNADNVWRGGSPQRGQIVGAMQRAAGAVEDHPLDSLAELRRYKTARADEAYANARGGLEESAAGKASLAAADSAGQHLDQAMYSAGPGVYGRYANANRDFGDAAAYEELLSQSRPQNPTADAIAGGAAAALSSGNPFVTGAASMLRRSVAPFALDAAANLGNGMASTLGGAGRTLDTLAMPAAMSTAEISSSDQQQAAQGRRGHLLPKQIAKALQTAPQVLGQYAQQLSQAQDDEELDAMIERLRRTDPRFETTIVPRFQGQGM